MVKGQIVLFWFCSLCCTIFFLLYITTVRSSPVGIGAVKRGYILDREGNPLVISKEHYRAYLILKRKSLVGDELSPEVRKYLSQGLNLPTKGLILLSEGLTPEEAQRLEAEDNVFIERSLERKVIYQEIEPLIGKVSFHEGISGIEKAFDQVLRKGGSLRTSLSLPLIKRLSNFGKVLPEVEEAIIVNKNGEIIGFFSVLPSSYFEDTFLLDPALFPNLDFSDLSWELGVHKLQREGNYLRITPLHLLSAKLRSKTKGLSNLTVRPREDAENAGSVEDKQNSLSPNEEVLLLPTHGKTLHLLSGKEKIALVLRKGTEERRLLSFFVERGLLK